MTPSDNKQDIPKKSDKDKKKEKDTMVNLWMDKLSTEPENEVEKDK